MSHKKLSSVLLISYLLLLIWILLFKFSLSFSDIAARLDQAVRSVNLLPFQGSKVVNGKLVLNEIILNGLIFVPLGVLLGIAAKNLSLIKKFVFICLFSFAIEILQFILGIGVTDVTDLLMNSVGGILGVGVYYGLALLVPETKLDRGLIIVGLTIGILFLGMVSLLRFSYH
ncbi:VanZ family protein [Enterococcus xiangfangensis]|uniref:VanZ family protein n=1 Tax=Enterococcus xiangfangensis TaxID=1296537 RepID=A0ABU3FA73_9ENTE|nr:VanZ family protein [Enterococcus xiangfangensis]MDT2758570.1 VanZ family protein [Enterococcus xiangfangensis]